MFLSHFESFYFLVKSRSYYDYFWREKFRGQKVFLSPKFGFFIPEKHFLSPKFFPPKIIMFLAVRRRNKGRFCFDVTMEESDIIDINQFGKPIISTKTSQKLLKCDKITYVPISGFLPVTRKNETGNFSFTRDFSIQF